MARDPSSTAIVVALSNMAGKHDELVRYLQMAPKTLRQSTYDRELGYAYARTGLLHDMSSAWP